MGTTRTAIAAMVLITLGGIVAPAPSDARGHHGDLQRVQSVSISPDEAAAIVRARTGGRVLSVDLRSNGRSWYRVKVLVSGERVRTLAVDADTGRLRD